MFSGLLSVTGPTETLPAAPLPEEDDPDWYQEQLLKNVDMINEVLN